MPIAPSGYGINALQAVAAANEASDYAGKAYVAAVRHAILKNPQFDREGGSNEVWVVQYYHHDNLPVVTSRLVRDERDLWEEAPAALRGAVTLVDARSGEALLSFPVE